MRKSPETALYAVLTASTPVRAYRYGCVPVRPTRDKSARQNGCAKRPNHGCEHVIHTFIHTLWILLILDCGYVDNVVDNLSPHVDNVVENIVTVSLSKNSSILGVSSHFGTRIELVRPVSPAGSPPAPCARPASVPLFVNSIVAPEFAPLTRDLSAITGNLPGGITIIGYRNAITPFNSGAFANRRIDSHF